MTGAASRGQAAPAYGPLARRVRARPAAYIYGLSWRTQDPPLHAGSSALLSAHAYAEQRIRMHNSRDLQLNLAPGMPAHPAGMRLQRARSPERPVTRLGPLRPWQRYSRWPSGHCLTRRWAAVCLRPARRVVRLTASGREGRPSWLTHHRSGGPGQVPRRRCGVTELHLSSHSSWDSPATDRSEGAKRSVMRRHRPQH